MKKNLPKMMRSLFVFFVAGLSLASCEYEKELGQRVEVKKDSTEFHGHLVSDQEEQNIEPIYISFDEAQDGEIDLRHLFNQGVAYYQGVDEDHPLAASKTLANLLGQEIQLNEYWSMRVTEAEEDQVRLSFVYSADSIKKTLHAGERFSKDFEVKMKQKDKSALVHIGDIKFFLHSSGNSAKLGGSN